LDLSPGWNLFILFGQNQPQHALYQRFPTPIRALPGSRRTSVLCRFPPVEDSSRYSWFEPLQPLFSLIVPRIGKSI